MKKLLGISIVAMLAVTPMMASAADVPAQVTLMTAPGSAAQTAGGKETPSLQANTQIATTSYVTGAYNALGAAHNVVEGRVTTLESGVGVAGSVDYKINAQAAGASYSNTYSALTATTIQGAIDEVEGRVDTLENNTTLTAQELGDHTALKSTTDVAANLVGLATAIESAGNAAQVENGNYILQNNSVSQNLTALDTAAGTNSVAIDAILDSNIPVYGTWGSATANNDVTIRSLQSTPSEPATPATPANNG